MIVMRPFDNWRAGDALPPAVVEEQRRRGNLADLVRNGFITDDAPPLLPLPTLDNLTYRELQRMAAVRDIAANQSREKLIEALNGVL